MIPVSERSWTWTLMDVLGRGGSGTVYRARGTDRAGFERDVAIKLLRDRNPSEEVLQRFRDEARVGSLVRDRAVVPVEPPTQIGDQWVVVMAYVEGLPLDALLQLDGALPSDVTAELVGELARALDAVHAARGPDGTPLGLVHRDIKPANVLLTPAGEVRLLDFGLAYARFRGREADTRHDLGGTPGYIAPERLAGIEDALGDVFSLGVLLTDCLEGRMSVMNGPTLMIGDPGPLAVGAGDRPSANGASAVEGPGGDIARGQLAELAAQMRADTPAHRPTMKEVARRCLQIAAAHRDQGLRDWCEIHARRERVGYPNDDRVGTVLSNPRPGRPAWTVAAGVAGAMAAVTTLAVAVTGGSASAVGVQAPAPSIVTAALAPSGPSPAGLGLALDAPAPAYPVPAPAPAYPVPAPAPAYPVPAPAPAYPAPGAVSAAGAAVAPAPSDGASDPGPSAPASRVSASRARSAATPRSAPAPEVPAVRIEVTSNVWGSTIQVDGVDMGRTPAVRKSALRLAPGLHRLTVVRDGEPSSEHVFVVGSGQADVFHWDGERGTWEARSSSSP